MLIKMKGSKRTIVSRILATPRSAKRVFVLLMDGALCAISVWTAFYLRLGEWSVSGYDRLTPAVVAIVISVPIFVRLGLYRAIFRYAGPSVMITLLMAVALYTIPFAAIFTFYGVAGVPRTVGLIQPILLFLLAGGARIFAYAWLGGHYQGIVGNGSVSPVLIYGAGENGRQLASAVNVNREMRLVGYIDDNPALRRSTINGVEIYGLRDVSRLVRSKEVRNVLLAIPSATRARRAEIVDTLRGHGIHVRTLPDFRDMLSGKISVSDLRELDIEDLLGRAAIAPDEMLMRSNVADKTVMVTGAGGSIGQELCRQILDIGPAVLMLVDMSEFALYSIHRELENRLVAGGAERSIRLIPLLASVGNEQLIDQIVGTWTPTTIFHAAAYKHVPMVEHNVLEGVRNNTIGTLVLAEAARRHGVANFVLISSDKAVRPTNVMGTTKRLSELILQAFSNDGEGATRFSMVRFGNVLGSSGSVVPMFRAQIAAGGPVTITHRDMTRYFMTISEAAQLVIQAGAMASGGDVFVLDMGEPVRILDLARNMIELSGLSVRDEGNPHGDIAIEVVGMRPGEKLYEELLIGENIVPSGHPRIMRAHEVLLPWDRLERILTDLGGAIDRGEADAAHRILLAAVPEFAPSSKLADWVHCQRYAETTASVG
ncbi:MAG: nucleoside-diphosphate sugar epimerase/dehydratase [Sphingomonas sp.]